MKSITGARARGERVKEAARRWAREYCEFAGFTPEEAEKIIREGKFMEKCAEAVAKEYEAMVRVRLSR